MKWFKMVFTLALCLGMIACKAEAAPLFDTPPETGVKEDTLIYVDIDGAIRNPGVYKVKSGTRLVHLVEMAGGFTMEARTEGLTLSGTLEDAKRYVIPSVHDDIPSDSSEDVFPEGDDTSDEPGPKVCINTASAETLATLPGIGPATAQAIIDHRESKGAFETLEALMDVKNIGEKTFESLEDLITLQP